MGGKWFICTALHPCRRKQEQKVNRCKMKIRNIFFSGIDIHSMQANFGILLLRVFAGLSLAFQHGVKKFPPSDKFFEIVNGLGFPISHFFAWASASTEFFGGLLLALGLMTRPAATFIIINLSVAAFIVHGGQPFGRKELALLFGFIAMAFLLIGSGRFGVDAFLRRKK
jgi:putative oxidoreductase